MYCHQLHFMNSGQEINSCVFNLCYCRVPSLGFMTLQIAEVWPTHFDEIFSKAILFVKLVEGCALSTG